MPQPSILTPLDSLTYTANELSRIIDNLARARPSHPDINLAIDILVAIWRSIVIRIETSSSPNPQGENNKIIIPEYFQWTK